MVNESERIKFEPHYKNLAVSGFDVKRKNQSIYIEAVPENAEWGEAKKSHTRVCIAFDQ